MSRTYGEPVQVKARPDGRPIRFVWRSRLYTVRAILGALGHQPGVVAGAGRFRGMPAPGPASPN